MKKLTCTLFVAMLTMVTMAFADTMPRSYFTVKNKTTGMVETIQMSQFKKDENGDYICNVDVKEICFGIYKEDQIEVTYTRAFATPTKLTWYYSLDGTEIEFGTGETAELTVPEASFNENTLILTCASQYNSMTGNNSSPTFYKIRLNNVHNTKRIYTTYSSTSREVLIFYEDYETEASSCTNQLPSTALYDISGNLISSGYLNPRGMGTLSTKGKTGILIVKVRINNVEIFTSKIQVK